MALALDSWGEVVRGLRSIPYWTLVVLTRAGFATSDQAVTMLGEPAPRAAMTNIGAGNAIEIWHPLNPARALVLSREPIPPLLIGLDDAHVRRVNWRLALESHRWIIYRPGTNPLKGISVPAAPPSFYAQRLTRVPGANGGWE